MELTDLPPFDEVYVPKPPKGKVFSNMRRNSGDAEGVDTPLFPTMMDVSHTTEGMASGSMPSSDQPTDDQTPPSHSKDIPQSSSKKPTPKISQVFERRKKHKVPSLGVSTQSPKPKSPVLEHSPIQNIQRETTGESPIPKKVHSKEKEVHVGSKAATTSVSTKKASGTISKTFPTATQPKKLGRGPRCPETTGAGSASARQKTPATFSKDPSQGVKTSDRGEDSYSIEELMETIGNVNLDVMAQQKEIDSLKKVVLHQQKQLDKQKKLIFKLLHKKKRSQFVLKRRVPKDDAPKKGEIQSDSEPNMEPHVHMSEAVEMEMEKEVEKEIAQEQGEKKDTAAAETEIPQAVVTEKTAETVTTAESEKAAEIIKAVVSDIAAETSLPAETVTAAESTKTAETVTAAESSKTVVTEEAAVTPEEAAVTPKATAVTRQPAVTVNTAELSHALLHHLAREIVVESLEEAVLRKAERLIKKVAEVKVSAEPPRPQLKRTKMMTKKRKYSKEDIEEKKAKRAKKREEKEKRREDKRKEKEYLEQHRIVENPNPQQPIEATPLTSKPPEIVHWDTFVDEETRREYIRVRRADGQFDVQSSWLGLIRKYTRSDIEEMHKVGMRLYGNLVCEEAEFSITKMVIEYLCCMFEPEAVEYLISRDFERVIIWKLHESCAVYSILLDNGLREYYLVDRIYRHSLKRLNGMIAAKLKCDQGSAMGSYLVRRTLNQQLGLDPNLCVYVD